MGHDQSKHKNERKGSSSTSDDAKFSAVHPNIEKYFNSASGGSDVISYERLVEIFDEDLAKSLWKYFVDSRPHSEAITKTDFNLKFAPLIGSSTDVYVEFLQPVFHFIKVCSNAANASAIQGDEQFIKCLVEDMTSSSGSSTSSICEWRRAVCPKFCNAVQTRVMEQFMGQINTEMDYSSDILTPMQMWYVQCCLPSIYFPNKDKSESRNWSPLYTSLQHGISTNRFETMVFDYRGPTITIFRLRDKRVVVLATDQEWRHGSSRFGGPATSFFEVSPKLNRVDASNSIYCNLKIRSAAFGISFKEIMKIDKEFSEVLDIEVWGCAGANTLAEQQKLKNWQKQQAEKHKKVPLPGNWDDNPDKSLLEMAGFQFSTERQNMEMEARRRDEKKE